MTYEELLTQRLEALLRTLKNDTMSDVLVEEYERIHRRLMQEQDEREWH